ncbi:glycoside hydrolase superfamily, partial [Tuber indicum]
PENSTKWDAAEPSRGNFNFSHADQLVSLAASNSKPVCGHTWVSNIGDRVTLSTVMRNHIATIVGRCKGNQY